MTDQPPGPDAGDGQATPPDDFSRQMEAHTKWLEAVYEKSRAYTNLVMMAGYAGFFGLWQVTKAIVGPRHSAWAALLMLFSLAVFVLFEVYKMLHSDRLLRGVLEWLHVRELVGDFISLPDKNKAFQDANRRAWVWSIRAQRTALWLSIPSALVATFILGSALVGEILKETG